MITMSSNPGMMIFILFVTTRMEIFAVIMFLMFTVNISIKWVVRILPGIIAMFLVFVRFGEVLL